MPSRRLAVIVVAAAFVRLFLLLSGTWLGIDVVMTYSTYDSNRYVVLADEMLAGHGFARPSEEGPVHLAVEKLRRSNGTWPVGEYVPEGFRTPGYPVFLALCGGRAGLHLALVLQVLLGACGTILAASIAFKLGLSSRACTTVALLWTFHPALVATDCLVLTESLFTTIGLAALAVALGRPSPSGFLLAGVLVGIDGLVRPLGLLYLVPIIILTRTSASRSLCLCLLILASATPSVAWAVRNHNAGYGYRVSTVTDINLYYYGASYVLSESRGEDWKKSWLANIDTLTSRIQQSLQPGEDVQSRMRSEALRIFSDNLMSTLKVAAKSEMKLIFDHSMEYAMAQYRLDFERTGIFSDLMDGRLTLRKLGFPQTFSMLWMLFNAAIALLSVLGLFHFLRRRQLRLLFGCLLPIVLFSAASFPVGLERFRIPFLIFLILPGAAVLFRQPTKPSWE